MSNYLYQKFLYAHKRTPKQSVGVECCVCTRHVCINPKPDLVEQYLDLQMFGFECALPASHLDLGDFIKCLTLFRELPTVRNPVLVGMISKLPKTIKL